MDSIWQFFMGAELAGSRDEINRENRLAIRTLAVIGLPLSAMNMLTQVLVVGGSMPLLRSCWLMIYFAVMAILERRVIPKDYPHATALLYAFEAPIMLIAVLLGTVWDPNHQATTIMLFIMAMPVFILDRPDRSLAISAGWALLFLVLCAAVKDAEFQHIDSVHMLEFYLTSAAITAVVLRIRTESLRHLRQAQHHLEHDPQTDCLNRYALSLRSERYLRRPLILLLGDMDQLKLYSDFYGHDMADAMNLYFTRTMMECFGAEDAYHFGGDEILCLTLNPSEDELKLRLARCRDKLHAFEHRGQRISLSFSVGYVTGAPNSEKELQDMIRLADIYAHQVKKSGVDQTMGGPFDQQHLREGIVESNISAHARAYEINALTGLPGMSYFVMRGGELLSTVADLRRRPVVGYFKLLHLREFNGKFGYAQGDQLIAYAGKLLRQHLEHRHICHITSGQFGIMCYYDEAEPAIRQVCDALRDFRSGFTVQSKAGFSEYTGQEAVISLMDQAKLAQKSIRSDPAATLRFYDAALDDEIQFGQYIVTHLDEAIENGYLKVYYQPIARAVTGEVCNEEALSRWDDPRYGFLMPGRFIPVLESNGLMYRVNLNVVRQVLRDFELRKRLGVPIVPVSVNLSRRDFESCDMVKAITDIVDPSGFPRDLIKIEITESAFTANQELLRREVKRLRKAGFEVWLDDFGSEYSTLNLLQEMDFDLIKLDMKFMKNFSTTSKNFIIVSSTIDMAKHMGITTLIEGVETPEQYAAMQKLGCEKIQGFLFNRPNSTDYIVQRALSGKGLVFEKPESTPYYEAISRVDFRSPMKQSGIDRDFDLDGDEPAGILELKDGKFTCLIGSRRFGRMLAAWGVLPKDGEVVRNRPLTDTPEELREAARRCIASGSWHSLNVVTEAEGPLSIYLRPASQHTFEGKTALLAVVLHG